MPRSRSGRRRLAAVFLGAGAAGDRPVAIWLPNSLEFIECDIACMRAGIPRVAVGDRLTAEECAFIVGHARAGILVTGARLLEQVRDVLPETVTLCLEVGSDVAGGYECALAAARPMTSFPIVPGQRPGHHRLHERHDRAAQRRHAFARRASRRHGRHVRVRVARARPLGRLPAHRPALARQRLQAAAGDRQRRLQRRRARVRWRPHRRDHPRGARHPHVPGTDHDPAPARAPGPACATRCARCGRSRSADRPSRRRSSARRSTRSARSSRRSTARRRCRIRSRCSGPRTMPSSPTARC